MIYWDYNATSPLRKSVKTRMMEAFEMFPGNPSSGHKLGQSCRGAMEEARTQIAKSLGCETGELIFTASATESNLMALWGLYWARNQGGAKNNKVIISPLEHSAIHENAKWMCEKSGAELVFTPLTKEGLVDLRALESLLQAGGIAFCSIIAAHNETGVIQPWKQASDLCAKYGIPFHTDFVQFYGRQALNLHSSGVTAATLAFHKSGGPKGLALLYLKTGTSFEPLVRGGAQEKKRRAGTSNIPAILGAEALAKEVPALIDLYQGKIKSLRDEFEKKLRVKCPRAIFVGEKLERLPNTSYVLFDGIRSDAMLMSLDLQGVCCSSGSACSSGMVLPSRALMCMGFSEEQSKCAVRFSLGAETTAEEVDQVIDSICTTLARLAA